MEFTAKIPRRRVRPSALPTVVTIVSIAIFLAAGEWQRERMEQKQSLLAQFELAQNAGPAPLPDTGEDWTAWRYRAVVAEGVFDAQRQILVDNKVHRGRIGFHVVTPLRLHDGRVVLVDRGFVAETGSRAALPTAPPPVGTVTVHGRINIPPARYLELARVPQAGPVWQNLDPARFSAATGISVLPIVVEQAAVEGRNDASIRRPIAPDFGIERHRGYMLQWYAFAVLAGGLWLYFNLWRGASRLATHA